MSNFNLSNDLPDDFPFPPQPVTRKEENVDIVEQSPEERATSEDPTNKHPLNSEETEVDEKVLVPKPFEDFK